MLAVFLKCKGIFHKCSSDVLLALCSCFICRLKHSLITLITLESCYKLYLICHKDLKKIVGGNPPIREIEIMQLNV